MRFTTPPTRAGSPRSVQLHSRPARTCEGYDRRYQPLVNSYKRLVPGYEAPCYLAWSASNRSALIRIPAARGQSTRVELRCPDPACNPYLALASAWRPAWTASRRT